MAKAFIVRPFGNRSVSVKEKGTEHISTVKFDFDKVEKELIKPAMEALSLDGGTTGEIFEAGDIREDMFSELLLADIVIADITVYNANVFYELGIRHALRDKITILIKCPGFDETPFDILTYKYISYDKERPGDSLTELIKFIQGTTNANRKDSPVFNILPLLKTQDPEKYLAIPGDFLDELRLAEETKSIGKLALLAYEAESFTWKFPALRLIGEALFNMMFEVRARETAKLVWEKIKSASPFDLQANNKLATIYQRMAETEMKNNPEEAISLLIKSDMAIETLISNISLDSYSRAEAYALKARNAKTKWMNSWEHLAGSECCKMAQQSLFLDSAFRNYEQAFNEDLNHYYSGINALGLLITIIALAEKDPETWELSYDIKEDADQKLKELKLKCQRLTTAVQFSIESAKTKLDKNGGTDHWLNITDADYCCLTSPNPGRVANMYKRALQDASGLITESALRQLKIYKALEIKTANVAAVFKAVPDQESQQNLTAYYLLFTGHMIDEPDRKAPRFPASKEALVRQWLKDQLTEEKNKLNERNYLVGIAGGACGGDILFHEVCAELEITTRMFIALPRESFIVESVAFAGKSWIERFDKLFKKLIHPVLSENKELPKWLQKKSGYDIWTRNNLWELNSALVNGGINMTLIALWDGKGGDGPGGTEHMITEAKRKGASIVRFDINNI